MRIDGLSGWMRVIQFIAAWVCFLGIGVALLLFLHRHPETELKILQGIFPPKTPDGQIPAAYTNLVHSGAWAGAIAVLAAALGKSGKWIKERLFDFKLEKLISRPDYSTHTAFIEEFHSDFARTIRAYAGNRKVYIFVDDLDRSDLLKAAELMQAINLMIGEDDHLVFILGIDRDKIAAGIAAKYKDVLPFLINTRTDSTISIEQKLAFGYQYLEKFIQLSFRIPLPDEEAVIQHFIERLTPSREEPKETHPTPAESSAKATQTRKFRRIDSGTDSQQVIQVVLMVRRLLGNNPRRLKQFLNSYRLSLYLASSQGLFDSNTGQTPITFEQLGKLVALVMRFPQLPSLLIENPALLTQYQGYAQDVSNHRVSGSTPLPKWMEGPEVTDLLAFGAWAADPEKYDLSKLDVMTLLHIMPTVPKPVTSESPQPPARPEPPPTGSAASISLEAAESSEDDFDGQPDAEPMYDDSIEGSAEEAPSEFSNSKVAKPVATRPKSAAPPRRSNLKK
jgi:hypothetical protein